MRDSPVAGGFGPKAPVNEAYLAQLDEECKAVGTVASYCMRAGVIPHVPLTGMRWSREGACLGQSGRLDSIIPVLSHLSAYAADILAADDSPSHLIRAWVNVRRGIVGEGGDIIKRGTVHLVPNELEGEWITLDAAIAYTGRAKSAIYEWVKSGAVHALDDDGAIVVQKNDLTVRMGAIADARKDRMLKLNETRRS